MACKYLDTCHLIYKEQYCSSILCKDVECATVRNTINKEINTVQKVIEKTENNPYWDNISKIAEKQREKGIRSYGMGLEENTWDIEKRIQYLEEELIDALMYCEWIKDYLSKQKVKENVNESEK